MAIIKLGCIRGNERAVGIGSSGKLLAAAGAAGILVALGVSFALPRLYVSQMVLLVEGPPTPQARVDFIHALAEHAWPRIVLGRIVENFCLYGSCRANLSPGDLVSKMRSGISTIPVGTRDNGYGTTFAIRFEYGDPAAAQKVVADLAQRLIADNRRSDELGIPGAYLKVISPPTLPRFPVSPKRLLLAGEGLAAGLLAGAFLAFRRRRHP